MQVDIFWSPPPERHAASEMTVAHQLCSPDRSDAMLPDFEPQ
jgi:hypothetical protein